MRYKIARLNNIRLMYLASRGILRIKTAADAAATTTGTSSTTPEEKKNPNEGYYTLGDGMADGAANLAEYMTGGDPSYNGWAGMAGRFASMLGSGIYNSVANGMANSKHGWMQGLGNFMQSNKDTLSRVAGGMAQDANNMWRADIRNNAIQNALKANPNQNPAGQASFDPDSMFRNMFQAMAGNQMPTQTQYQAQGNAYRPNFM